MATTLKFCKACNTETEHGERGRCLPCRRAANAQRRSQPGVREREYARKVEYYYRNPEAFNRLVQDVETFIREPLRAAPKGVNYFKMDADQRFKTRIKYHLSDLPRFYKLKADVADLLAMVSL